MKTKILTLFLVLVSSVGFIWASDTQVNGIWYDFNESTQTASVTYQGNNSYGNYDRYSGSVTIPSSVNYNGKTYSVTNIGGSAFYGCSGLTNITIPNSITSIGSSAFYGCSGLTNIIIPGSVTSIGGTAFYQVPNVIYNGIANGSPWGARCVNGYEEGWFVYSDSTKANLKACSPSAQGTIIIPSSVTNIGSYAFYGCTGLTSVTIPNSVTSIESYVFYGCSSLTDISIPNSVMNIGDLVFAGCYSFPVENSIRYAGEYLIEVVEDTLSTYTIKEGTKWIGFSAFAQCHNLTSIVIPNGVKSIGSYAFDMCDKLTSVEIPNSVISIGREAFYSCYNLKNITIPNNVTNIEDKTFYYCSGLTNVSIPNSVTSIGEEVFAWCNSLTSIVIPNSVTSIGKLAFMGCSGLTSITIPNSITNIEEKTFCYCSCLTNITIPNCVTSIGDGAFAVCSNLTNVTIPNSVRSIGDEAFAGCFSLTNVTIPNSVINIGWRVFDECDSLTSITNYATIPQVISTYTFYKVDSTCILYVPNESIELYKTTDVWKEFVNILPIGAKGVEVETMTIITTETTADIAWPQVNGAYTYELVIKDSNGNVVCTLVFDVEGHLLRMAFSAPSKDGAPRQTQSIGFAFTVTGLDNGTTYNYTITAKDNNGSTLNVETGSFVTQGVTTSLSNVHNNNAQGTKVIRDGQIFIRRGEKTYTLQGNEVR